MTTKPVQQVPRTAPLTEHVDLARLVGQAGLLGDLHQQRLGDTREDVQGRKETREADDGDAPRRRRAEATRVAHG